MSKTKDCGWIPSSILPYTFRKRGSPAVRIQTMKCSFRTPSIGFTMFGYVS